MKQFSVKEVWNIYTKILLVVVLHKNAHAHSLRGSCFLKNEKKKKMKRKQKEKKICKEHNVHFYLGYKVRTVIDVEALQRKRNKPFSLFLSKVDSKVTGR